MMKVIGWIVLAFVVTIAVYVAIWVARSIVLPALQKVEWKKGVEVVKNSVVRMESITIDEGADGLPSI